MANYRVKTLRGANMIDALPERLEAADGRRWACGRYVKGETATPGVYNGVQVWTLKERDAAGKAVTVDIHRDRAEALAWCGLTEEA